MNRRVFLSFPANSRAFTLAETLLTLSLMGILMSVGTASAFRALRNSRQAALDGMARTLYISAQMSLTAAKFSGRELDADALQAAEARPAKSKLAFVEDADGALKMTLSDNPAPDYQLWKTDADAQTLQDFLFPRLSVNQTRSVSAELFNGYWIVAFDPIRYSVVSVYYSQNDGENGEQTAYFRALSNDANRQERLSELTAREARLRDGALIGYYGPESAGRAPDMPFDWIPGGGPDANQLPQNPALLTPDDTVTQKTPVNDPEQAANIANRLYCWIGCDENPQAPIRNAETLVTRLNCWIPADSAFEKYNRPADVEFTLTVKGVSSGKSKAFRYAMKDFGVNLLCRDMETSAQISIPAEEILRRETREAVDANGKAVAVSGWRYSYPVILDSSADDGEGAFLHGNRPFKARFPDFIPGEDLMLQFEADADGETKKAAKQAALQALSDAEKAAHGLDRIGEQAIVHDESGAYDWLWKCHRPGWNEYPVSNSLFADAYADGRRDYATLVDADGAYTAKIACARHLRNLDAATSGFGGNLDGIKSYDAAAIGAASVRALQIADLDLTEADAFAPVGNAKLAKYNGGGFRIANLRVDMTGRECESAGLFGTLTGSVTLENLTLTDPVILADHAQSVGGLVGKVGAGARVTVSALTLVDPVILAKNAQGVGGMIGAADAESRVTLSRAQLYMTEKSCQGKRLDDVLETWLVGGECVGGLIGFAAGDATITDADGVPSFAATVISASAYAGGLTGYVGGALNVSGAWADCYLKADGDAARIGGLAGYCGADSAFQRCYAAGFAVSACRDGDAETIAHTPQPVTAAGFAPCNVASVADAYSIFNFDDPSLSNPPLVLNMSAKYGLCAGAACVSNAFFAYGGEVGGPGEETDGETLKTALSGENGFQIGEAETASYGLTDAPSAVPYPYPTLGGPHYNDYLIAERPAPTEMPTETPTIDLLVQFVFRDTADADCLYPDAGIWDSPDGLRDALPSAPFAPGQEGYAFVKIPCAAGTKLRDNLDGLSFEGFTLDEAASTLDAIISETPLESDVFMLWYNRT